MVGFGVLGMGGRKERVRDGAVGAEGRKKIGTDEMCVSKKASQLSQTRRILRLVPEYGILSMIDILRARTVING